MSKQMKMIACILVSAVMLSAVALPAQAGSVTIYNENCTKQSHGKRVKHVKVHVFGQKGKSCTDTHVTVHQGESETVQLKAQYRGSGVESNTLYPCKYKHEAQGTVGGKRHVLGSEHSTVTCKRDWARVCQCTKD